MKWIIKHNIGTSSIYYSVGESHSSYILNVYKFFTYLLYKNTKEKNTIKIKLSLFMYTNIPFICHI